MDSAVSINLDAFPPIGLDEMDSVKLLNRIDTKFVTTEVMLEKLLAKALEGGYRVLVTDGKRTGLYDSLYFDTEDLRMYMDHQNGRPVRTKVRTRCYLNSGTTFLEVKRKDNHKRTGKKRMEIPPSEFDGFAQDNAACEFLSAKSGFELSSLAPRLNTCFERITLVNSGLSERITIDTHLHFHNHTTHSDADLGSAVIIELKQDGNLPSQMKEILMSLRVKPFSISKYCIGNVLTDPAVKSNRFKYKIRYINKFVL